jgi:hypothetical protein
MLRNLKLVTLDFVFGKSKFYMLLSYQMLIKLVRNLPLLPGSVPQLDADQSIMDLNMFYGKVDANCSIE